MNSFFYKIKLSYWKLKLNSSLKLFGEIWNRKHLYYIDFGNFCVACRPMIDVWLIMFTWRPMTNTSSTFKTRTEIWNLNKVHKYIPCLSYCTVHDLMCKTQIKNCRIKRMTNAHCHNEKKSFNKSFVEITSVLKDTKMSSTFVYKLISK